ncbi:P-loop containing nucleoside triphosphate hydrolase protein [Diaporthe sp. PMI_573]|nr:P-loop containing nucleoside triphosphate hydrolase protein [Diaporthaceae sp. PMI_573]
MWERFGTSMMLILVCMSVAYYCCERKYVAVYLRLYSTFVGARDSQERRRQDGIRGWITVSAHNMVGRENELYAGEVNELMKRLRAYKLCGVFYTCIDELILQLADGLGWALVILRVLNYEATIGSLTAFLGLWNALMEPISFFKSFVTGAMEELSDMVRLKKLMEENPRIQDGEKCLRPTNGQVRLENVSLAYSESEQASLIVNNLSLTIEGGTKGASSSTARNIAAVSKDSLHNAVGMMVQDPHIFDRTVLFNIRYAKPDATIDEVHAACKSAGIHKTIMGRQGGYDALTGANGANFSGGERQRLLLARLFLLKPKIVLIDEGTSALDSQTESDIKHSISREFPSSTVIIIAHRLSSIRNADRIIVLDHGCKIVEDGTHDNLVAQEGEYAGFWKMHLGIDDLEDTSTSETPLIDIA